MAKSTKNEPKLGTEKSKQKQGWRFQPGQSGNPRGRPKGAINHVNRRIKQLMEARADEVVEAALDRAIAEGDAPIIKMILDRLSPAPSHPPRDPYPLGDLDSIEQCTVEMKRLAATVAVGEIDEDHASEIASRIRDAARLLSSGELEQRLKALEARLGLNA